MKHHGATKVVNPLGTVVTVPDADVDCSKPAEEVVVIHENCDEALFRPVIASKSLHYADANTNKTLIGDSICTKNLKSTTELTYKISNAIKTGGGKNKRSKNEKNHLELGSHKPEMNSRPSTVKMLVAEQQPPPDCDFVEKNDVFEPEIPLNFEDAQDAPLKNSSSEENVIEDKIVTKKARKPKAKLGVRIPTVKIEEEPPKKSWSTIVSTKQSKELIDLDFQLAQCEQLAKDLFVDDVFNETKCSDDEKINGSQTETTESDDSAKIPKQIEDSTNQLEIFVDTNSQMKPTKRKSKKKKK